MHTKRIMKFGGSSLSSGECFMRVAEIIEGEINLKPIIVLSAVGVIDKSEAKVTDMLMEAGKNAFGGKDCSDIIDKISAKHRRIVRDLNLEEEIIADSIRRLEKICEKISAGEFGELSPSLDAVMGFGEILSSGIMENLLRRRGHNYILGDLLKFGFITDDNFQDAEILEESLENIAKNVIACKDLLIFPGYGGYTADGRPTTLGRGGSDYTAGIIGAALKKDVEIWTDVDGIYRISPAYLPQQFRGGGHPETIPEISYEEAFQMAAFGSRVLQKKTLDAVRQAARKGKHIRLIIKNTFNPRHPGTVVSSKRRQEGIPQGITCLEGTNLFNFYPSNSREACEISHKISRIEGINTVLSSETYQRLSFVFDKYDGSLSTLETQYQSHLSKDQVLIKIVGDGLGKNPQVLSKIHNALQSAENPEKYGMNLVHKSPQLLTDDTFEFVVKKRGVSDVILSLYKALFMENVINVGLMGFGTVGSGVIKYCRDMYSPQKGGFEVRFPWILVRDLKKRRETPAESKITTSPEDILKDPLVDVVLEVMGGIEPAKDYIVEAFKNGKDVVTANKALLANCGGEIFEAACKYRRNIGFEASVCAEIPIIDDLLTFPGLADIRGIEGIVNGTSNYILSRFMDGMSFEEALKIAQEKGFAEADPFMDVSGTDAAQKLSILTSILFNQPVDYKQIPLQGIDGLLPVDRAAFEKLNLIIKPLARAEIIDGEISLRVSPALVNLNHPLASVRDENNAISLYLTGREEPITKIGKGAGSIPTARSVVRDTLDVSRKSKSYMVDLPGFFNNKNPIPIASAQKNNGRWYLRFTVDDTPGVLGRITTVMGDFQVSIYQVMQEQDVERVHILFQLKESPWGKIEQVIDLVKRFPFVKEYYSCMML